MVNYTHKRPPCGHCAPPLHEIWGSADKFSPPSQCIFSARSASTNPPHSPAMRPVCLLDRTKNLPRSDGLHFISTSPPISQRPSGLTSWAFMVNYTHKRPPCGHCAPPLHEIWGSADKFSPPSQCIFSARSASTNPPHSPAMRPVCLLDRTKNLPRSDGLHFISTSPPISQRPSGLTSWAFMVQ